VICVSVKKYDAEDHQIKKRADSLGITKAREANTIIS